MVLVFGVWAEDEEILAPGRGLGHYHQMIQLMRMLLLVAGCRFRCHSCDGRRSLYHARCDTSEHIQQYLKAAIRKDVDMSAEVGKAYPTVEGGLRVRVTII